MNITFVTTYGQNCGIARYSETLVAALRRTGATVTVLGERAASQRDELAPIPDARTWTRGGSDFGVTEPCDVLHAQHETGFWRDDRTFHAAVTAARVAGVRRVVVTVHTPAPLGVGPDVLVAIARDADTVVTLTTAGAEAMRSCGLNAHVAVDVIPHPVVPRTPMAPDAAWAILREHPSFRALSPATPFVLCLGFLTSAKRLFDVIDATRIVPVTLVLAGAMPEHEYGAEGYARVLHEVVRSPAGQHVVLSIGHVNEDTTTALYSLAVAAIVPRVWWSGSGAEATALGFGVPVVAGGLREADDGEGILPYTSIAHLEQALHRLVTAAPRAVRPQTLATVRSPVAVAEAHLALYRRFLS